METIFVLLRLQSSRLLATERSTRHPACNNLNMLMRDRENETNRKSLGGGQICVKVARPSIDISPIFFPGATLVLFAAITARNRGGNHHYDRSRAKYAPNLRVERRFGCAHHEGSSSNRKQVGRPQNFRRCLRLRHFCWKKKFWSLQNVSRNSKPLYSN